VFEPEEFFDLSGIEKELFENVNLVWEVLRKLEKFLKEYARPEIRGVIKGGVFIEGNVFIDEGTVIEPFVYIKGPAYIGKNCEIRQGAYKR